MSFKQRAIISLTWSYIDNFIIQISQFIIGLILTRLLTPESFGLIGMIMIFVGISQNLTEAGLRQSLIRQLNCSETDYNTIFFLSVSVALLIYIFLFLISPLIAVFFSEPKLESILRIISLYLVIDALGNVHGAIMLRNMNYKLKAKINFISSLTSGIFAILIANFGFEVWSLVSRQLLQGLIFVSLLWYNIKWRPKFIFSYDRLKIHLKFGLPLLGQNLLETLYNNLFYIVIGKFYSKKELGLYTRALTFSSLTTTGLYEAIDRVILPLLSKLQNDDYELKSKFKFLFKYVSFIIFFLSTFVAATTPSLVPILLGNKWMAIENYIRLLCFVLIWYPIISININLLKIKGKTKTFLFIELFRKVLILPILIVAIHFNVIYLIIGLLIHTVLSWLIYSYVTSKILFYRLSEQFKDFIPSIWVAIINMFLLNSLNEIGLNYFMLLSIQIITSTLIFIIICKIFRINYLNLFPNLIFSK